MATKHQPGDGDSGTAVVTETKKKEKLKKPPLYKVIFHNDNYTTMEFVVQALMEFFQKNESDAVAIMLSIHRTGFGVAGVYTHEVAETKMEKTHAAARAREYPLRLTMEPEEL